MPTGGVSTENLPEYLYLATVACVGGTWLATREAIAEKKWEEIKRNCRAAEEIVRAVRGTHS